jgi:hypothetical protein
MLAHTIARLTSCLSTEPILRCRLVPSLVINVTIAFEQKCIGLLWNTSTQLRVNFLAEAREQGAPEFGNAHGAPARDNPLPVEQFSGERSLRELRLARIYVCVTFFRSKLLLGAYATRVRSEERWHIIPPSSSVVRR